MAIFNIEHRSGELLLISSRLVYLLSFQGTGLHLVHFRLVDTSGIDCGFRLVRIGCLGGLLRFSDQAPVYLNDKFFDILRLLIHLTSIAFPGLIDVCESSFLLKLSDLHILFKS